MSLSKRSAWLEFKEGKVEGVKVIKMARDSCTGQDVGFYLGSARKLRYNVECAFANELCHAAYL